MNKQWPNEQDMRAQDKQTERFPSHNYLVEAALDREWEEAHCNNCNNLSASDSRRHAQQFQRSSEGLTVSSGEAGNL